MGTKKTVVITATIIVISINAFSQKSGVGGSLIYNFQTKSIGFGLRGEFPLNNILILDGLSIVPQISYFPSFNKITEYYIGSSAHLGFYSNKKRKYYALVNLSYNGWINHESSAKSNAKYSNLGFDVGVGVTSKKCLRPFMELRYNVKWREASLHAGVLYTINCNKRGAVPCSKIPKLPQL